MKTPKVPASATPAVAAPIPVPQPDSPELIDTQRRVRAEAASRQGSRASLLTPGGDRGVSGSGETKRRRLGLGALAAGY
jgi:hypothetical protein